MASQVSGLEYRRKLLEGIFRGSYIEMIGRKKCKNFNLRGLYVLIKAYNPESAYKKDFASFVFSKKKFDNFSSGRCPLFVPGRA